MPSKRPGTPGKPQPPVKAPCGRPPKFNEPSRPVTVTLPESTLGHLAMIDHDRGRAIVKLANQAVKRAGALPPPVEVVEMAQGTGLIIVGASSFLRQIPFLHMVEVAPGRFLLALDAGHDFRSLEIAMQDGLDSLSEDAQQEQEMVRQLLAQVRQARRSQRFSMAQILLVALE